AHRPPPSASRAGAEAGARVRDAQDDTAAPAGGERGHGEAGRIAGGGGLMPGRRPILLLAMLAALVMAPSTVSAAKPAPKMVTVDASPQPGSSDSPTNAAASPTNPPPASAAPAPRATATPQPSMAPAPQQQATA